MSLLNMNMDIEYSEIDKFCLECFNKWVAEYSKWIVYNKEYVMLWTIAIMILAMFDLYRYNKEVGEKLVEFREMQTTWNEEMESKMKKLRKTIQQTVDNIHLEIDVLNSGAISSLEKMEIQNKELRETYNMDISELSNKIELYHEELREIEKIQNIEIEKLNENLDIHYEETNEMEKMQNMEIEKLIETVIHNYNETREMDKTQTIKIENLNKEIKACNEKWREIEETHQKEIENFEKKIELQNEFILECMDSVTVKKSSVKNNQNYVLIGFHLSPPYKIPIFIPGNIETFDTNTISKYNLNSDNVNLLLERFSELKYIKKIDFKHLHVCRLAKDIDNTFPFENSPNCIWNGRPWSRRESIEPQSLGRRYTNYILNIKKDPENKKLLDVYEILKSYDIELIFEEPLHEYLFEK